MSDVRLFKDTNAIDSLRNSDFDAISAYGEVVDNSIEANSKNIRIKFDTESKTTNYVGIKRVAFGDDGDGMNSATLNRCLQIGWSSRFNSRNGIGRFGVGMTLAAIHECRRVDVYSKEKNGDWIWTYIDLDENKSGKQEAIPVPKNRNIPPEFSDLVGDVSGTLVVWSKYDRQSLSASVLMKNAIVWMGRTYRYFIWDDGVRILINGEEIRAIDPLYYRVEKTRFPEDPPATLFKDITFNWPVGAFDAPENSPKTSPILIRMSLVDKSLRPERGSGGWAATTGRFIDQNEGISILRNRREVFYGPIPYWKHAGKGWPQFEEIDRWWGCEIHFHAILDRAFTVKNIKRGANPSTELKKAIKDQISPTRETCCEKIRDLWNAKALEKKQQETADSEDPLNRPDDHKDAEQTAKHTPTDKSNLDEDKDFETEVSGFIDKNLKNYNEEQKAAAKSLFESQPFTILESTWSGPQFIDASFFGGHSALTYNMSHKFFQEVYRIIESLNEEGVNDKEVARKLKTLIDILIIAYAKAQTRFSKDAEMSVEEFLESLTANWGQYLVSYVRTWVREQNDESTN